MEQADTFLVDMHMKSTSPSVMATHTPPWVLEELELLGMNIKTRIPRNYLKAMVE